MDYATAVIGATFLASSGCVIYRLFDRLDARELAVGLYESGFIKERPTFWNCRRAIEKIQI